MAAPKLDITFKTRAKHLAQSAERRLNRNVGLRVLSVLIAIGLWIFVNAGQRNAIQSFQVPLAYRGLPSGLVIVNRPTEFVRIQVTGPRTLLSLLDPERLSVPLDLSGIGPGQAAFKINPTMFNVPRQTTVTGVAPAEVIFEIDRIVRRDVPVRVNLQGAVAPGYTISGVELTPPSVMVTGPSRYVNPLQQVYTEPLDVSGAKAQIVRKLFLENESEPARMSAKLVDAKLFVTEKIGEREFPRIAVQVRDSDYRFNVQPRFAAVTIRGPELSLSRLDPSTLAYVDATDLTPGSHDLPLQIDVPDGMSVVRQNPEKVKLRLYHGKRTASNP
ncbi:MAG TPA: CdaR family protein [Candidatus Binataceae bacterium]|nr:CdaR family protein [Candidatus Binataceae bacterium]